MKHDATNAIVHMKSEQNCILYNYGYILDKFHISGGSINLSFGIDDLLDRCKGASVPPRGDTDAFRECRTEIFYVGKA